MEGGGRKDYFSMHNKEITALRNRKPAEDFMQCEFFVYGNCFFVVFMTMRVIFRI